MSFSSDGRWLACGGDDPVVRLWNLSEINSKPALLSGHTGPVETVVFDRQNSRLASGSRDGTVRLWNLSSPQTATAVLGPYSGAVRALSFDDAGDYLLIAANHTATEPDGQMGIPMMGRNDIGPGSLLCYDLRPGHEHLPVLQMPGDFPEISSMLLSPDGTTLAAVCSDQKVRF
jgi:WD40 repeat protein